MDLRLMTPTTAALLDLATDGRFLETLAPLLDDPEVVDVHVLLDRRPPSFVVILIGASGERIVAAEHELLVVAKLPEHVRAAVLIMWIDQILAAHDAWARRMAPRLRAVGARPLGVFGAGSS